MSANIKIPFDIQVEIIKKVAPIKSLIRFRSVSKQWKSLINSSEFINHHSVNQAHQHHLLVSSYEPKHELVSIVDDDSFPMRKFPHIGFPIFKPASFVFVNSSHGLVCLHECRGETYSTIILWNPSIQKSVSIELSYGRYVFGFGVCPDTIEPKIVRLAPIVNSMTIKTIGYMAEVYTLSSGAWRSISVNLSLKENVFIHSPVVTDVVIYWLAYNALTSAYRVTSFNLTREEFGEVDLPDALANGSVSISKINESLVVIRCCNIVESDVWMMLKNGSFTKLFTVKASPNRMHGFRKNGQPIVEHIAIIDGSKRQLQCYEPSLKRIINLGIYGLVFKVISYTESLLLLNHPKKEKNKVGPPL